jgi:hypothetical protein
VIEHGVLRIDGGPAKGAVTVTTVNTMGTVTP